MAEWDIHAEAISDPATLRLHASGGATCDDRAVADDTLHWSFGDGVTATGRSAVYDFARAGSYVLSLGAAAVDGSTAVIAQTVRVPDVGCPPGEAWKLASSSPLPNSGDRLTATKLTITTPGAVYSGWRFDRLVEVRAPGVRFFHCEFAGIDGNPADSALLYVNPAGQPGGQPHVEVFECTFRPAHPNSTTDGVRGSNFTLRRCEITQTVDGVHIHGPVGKRTAAAGNVLLDECWIHDLPHYDDGSRADGSGTHNDGVQIVGGRGIQIIGTRIDGQMSSAAIMATQDVQPIADVTVDGCFLAGGRATVNINDTVGGAPAPITGLTITGNVFERGTSTLGDFPMLITQTTSSQATITDNAWSDGSSPAPRVRKG